MSRVIVIGQGAAGLTASLALAQEGIAVTSISQTRPGSATCTIYAGGGFTLPVDGMLPYEHRKMTYDTGRHLNVPELLEVFSFESPSIVRFLEDAKVPFRLRRGGLGLRRDPGFPLLGGKALIDGLQAACLNHGVEFVSNLAATRILTRDLAVTGVECIDYSKGEPVTMTADAVVLATGGGGALYGRTDNPQRITGDGYRLALDAGCHLMDMEFVQFYPMGFDIPRGAHWFVDLSIVDIARVTAPDGREFLKELLTQKGIGSGREANLLARDICSVAIALENEKGHCLLHTEDVPEEVWRRRFGAIARMFPASNPPWKAPVPLGPIQHYFPGGVLIGDEGQTEIPGLFACGEVTGGVDGANRVGGNALTNCVLFGIRSAKAVARHAKGEPVEPALCPTTAPRLNGRNSRYDAPLPTNSGRKPYATETEGLSPMNLPKARSSHQWLSLWRSGKVAPSDLRSRLKGFSGRYLMPCRRGALLLDAAQEIQSLGGLLDEQAVKDSRDLLLAVENLGLWYTAAMVFKGALIRQESRGAHYRADFPTENPLWQRHIYMGNSGGSLEPTLGEPQS